MIALFEIWFLLVLVVELSAVPETNRPVRAHRSPRAMASCASRSASSDWPTARAKAAFMRTMPQGISRNRIRRAGSGRDYNFFACLLCKASPRR